MSTTKPIAHFLPPRRRGVGNRVQFHTDRYGRAIPPGKVIVHATNDPADVNKDIRADYALIGDAKLTLRALIAEVEGRTNGVGHRNERDVGPEVQAVKREWLDEWRPQLTSDEEPINQYRIIWDLMHNVDRANTIITHDAGSPRDQMTPFWETTTPRTYIGWGKTTQLGYGLGLAMGAKLAEPDKLCVNVMGDAAIGMVGMDLETAARNRIGHTDDSVEQRRHGDRARRNALRHRELRVAHAGRQLRRGGEGVGRLGRASDQAPRSSYRRSKRR